MSSLHFLIESDNCNRFISNISTESTLFQTFEVYNEPQGDLAVLP